MTNSGGLSDSKHAGFGMIVRESAKARMRSGRDFCLGRISNEALAADAADWAEPVAGGCVCGRTNRPDVADVSVFAEANFAYLFRKLARFSNRKAALLCWNASASITEART